MYVWQITKLLEEISEKILPDKPGASLEEIVTALSELDGREHRRRGWKGEETGQRQPPN